MARVLIKLYGALGEKLGGSELSVQADSLATALKEVAAASPPEVQELIFEDGRLRGHFVVMHNGKVRSQQEADSVWLSEGDVIHILPPVAGG
jgi:molybdopterin converting factor small subunit